MSTKVNYLYLEDIKKCKKDKKKYAKLYSDWKDDEFNCGPLRYIYGVKYNNEDASSFNTLNIMDICFNRDTEKYIVCLDFSVSDKYSTNDSMLNMLTILLEKFSYFIRNNEYFDHSFNPFSINVYEDGNIYVGNNLTELYYKFKIFVNGLKGL